MAQDENYMLSTKDNPYDPHTQWDEWYTFDEAKGYNTCGLLDRFLFSSLELSEADQDAAIEAAMDEIIELNPTGNLVKVSRKS